MVRATSRLLALILLSVPLLVSCITCDSRQVYEADLPVPEKCWECPEIKDAFEYGKRNIYGDENSYGNFFCKYTISVGKKTTYLPDSETGRINQYAGKAEVPIYCYYDKDGHITSSVRKRSDRRCKQQAIAVPNCTPVNFTNYTGPYEVCCRKGCELEAPGRCFHCPIIGGDFVDVDIKPGYPIECTYHGLGGPQWRAVDICYFDPVTGEAVPGYKGEKRCDGNTARAGQRDDCRDRLPTCPRDCKPPQQCWDCPQIAGWVAENLFGEKSENFLVCSYENAKEPSPVTMFNCDWDQRTGKPSTIGRTNVKCPRTPACLFDKYRGAT